MTTGTKILDRSPYSYYSKSWSGSDWSSPTPPDGGLVSYWKRTEQALSDSIPGFEKVQGVRGKPRRSKLEDHPYSMDLLLWGQSEGKVVVLDPYPPHNPIGTNTYWFRTIYNDGYSSDFGSAWTSNDDIALTGKLREKIVGSDFDMGVFLGEGREALNLISSTASRLYNFYRGMRRLDVKQMSKALGLPESRVASAMKRGSRSESLAHRLARANLELQYGWMPLVQDAYGGAQALAQQLNEPAVQSYRARMRKPIRKLGIASSNISEHTFHGEVRAQYIARLKEANIAALNGLVDPSSVLWELTPWSFVADWFIPIGNYLQARSFSSAVSGTFVKTITREERFYGMGNPQNPWYVQGPQTYEVLIRIKVTRTVSTSISVPKPQFKSLAQVFSWKRALNAVSLLTLMKR